MKNSTKKFLNLFKDAMIKLAKSGKKFKEAIAYRPKAVKVCQLS
jgi:hypothetical protein